MLMNFCDPRLRPEVHCDTISTEGYEATNLISGSSKGFLAYSCIRPPVNIDLTFVCNVKINYILIWPTVGSQKSSGIQLYGKSTNDINTPYTLVSSGYLNAGDAGLLFYPLDIDHEKIPAPANFLKRYIKISYLGITTYTNTLRISICKTQNSVPALSKIEVWGTVSPRCGRDVVASVHTLWVTHASALDKAPIKLGQDNHVAKKNVKELSTSLEIPTDFLDAITWEIMTQPIILPSGNIVDQTTLQKYEETEAIWGRTPADPFTGIPFSEYRKPTVASALKTRIDKYLLENCDAHEIKKLPRVLGNKCSVSLAKTEKLLAAPAHTFKQSFIESNMENVDRKLNSRIAKEDLHKRKNCHQLPIISCPTQFSERPIRLIKKQKIFESSSTHLCNKQSDVKNGSASPINTDNNLDGDIQTLLSQLKRFIEPEKNEYNIRSSKCECCSNSISYELPCKHVTCRKMLISNDQDQCKSCGVFYKRTDVVRIHL